MAENAEFLANEKVDIYNINNGVRFLTYVIEAPRGSGEIGLNGAAARLVMAGDKVIIVAFATMDEAEAKTHRPNVVLLGDDNKVIG